MITYFPKYFSNRAIALYFILLLLVPLVFGYPMPWYGWVFGIISVCGFFYFSNVLTKDWQRYSGKRLEGKLFRTSVWIRIIYVIISYFFYKEMTGVPFEFGAGDSHWYDDMGRLGSKIIWGADIKWSVFFQNVEATDLGYPMYLTVIYALTGNSILLSRIIKAIISAFTVVLMYRLANRNFGESIARITGIFCMLMPNLIYYCGLSLKEVEMLFLTVLFIERADYVIRRGKIRFSDLGMLAAITLASYFFRGVLSIVLLLSFVATMVFSSRKIKKSGKWTIEGVLIIFLAVTIFYNKSSEILGIGEYAHIQEAQNANMEWRADRAGGNAYAVNVGSVIFAPLIFTIPFPTLVNIEFQQDQQVINGGNFVKNITSALTILAMILLFMSGKWRDHVLPIAFCLGYLLVLVFSNYAQSERFHIPVLPFELMFAAVGLSLFKQKYKGWVSIWLGFIFIANMAWAWFKLRGRGM